MFPAVSVWSLIWNSSTRPLRLGSALNCESPNQFCVVVPNNEGLIVTPAFVAAKEPFTYIVAVLVLVENVTAMWFQTPAVSAMELESVCSVPRRCEWRSEAWLHGLRLRRIAA